MQWTDNLESNAVLVNEQGIRLPAYCNLDVERFEQTVSQVSNF